MAKISEGITVAISTAIEPNLKQNGACLLNTKEQPADGKPWVNALSTSEILAPIPEVDSSLASGEAAEISNGTTKPKALPLTVSQAARQGLAKVVAPKTLQKQTQSQLGGYVLLIPHFQSHWCRKQLLYVEELLATGVLLSKLSRRANLIRARSLKEDPLKEY